MTSWIPDETKQRWRAMPEKQQNDVISGFIGILFVIAGITWLMGFGGFLIGVGLIFLLVAAV